MFKPFQQIVAAQFDRMQTFPLVKTRINPQEMWEAYLQSIPDKHRASNVCNTCRHFIQQYGGIVAVEESGEVRTLWDSIGNVPPETLEEYADACVTLRGWVRDMVTHSRIEAAFFTPMQVMGTVSNRDKKNPGVEWNHFYIRLPHGHHRLHPADKIPTLVGECNTSHALLVKAVSTITPHAVSQVLELIKRGALYRGSEFKAQVALFQKIRDSWSRHSEFSPQCEMKLWYHVMEAHASVTRIANTAIGTLLTDLSEGMAIEKAVSSYESKVAPENYQRTTALVTTSMIDAARAKIVELGFARPLLERRQLNHTDIPLAACLYVDRGTALQGDAFSAAARGNRVEPEKVSRVAEMSMFDFISNVLPQAKEIRLLLKNQHANNLATLTGPADVQNETNGSAFKWGNAFGWSFTGGTADAIKNRVKNAGGSVTGKLRVSLAWNNTDDLDLMVREDIPGHDAFLLYYGDARSRVTQAALDVDMNRPGTVLSMEPVENIIYPKDLPDGTYLIQVNNFQKRMNSDQGFTVEIEHEGGVMTLEYPNNNVDYLPIATLLVQAGKPTVVPASKVSAGTARSSIKWGLATEQFHRVRAIVPSPNQWADHAQQVGNNLTFFLLEHCKCDEKIRPFYNEFLPAALHEHRKVTEIVAGHVEVAGATDEASGLGFGAGAEITLEVLTSFRQVIKVKI